MPDTRLGAMLLLGQGQLALAAASVAVAEGNLEMLGFLFESEARGPNEMSSLDDYNPMDFLMELSVEEALKNPPRRVRYDYRDLEYPNASRTSRLLRQRNR